MTQNVVISRLAGKYMLYCESFLLYNFDELWKLNEDSL